MKKKSVLWILLGIAVFIVGYLSCMALHHFIATKHSIKHQIPFDTEAMMAQDLVDMFTGQKIPQDTLSFHKKNLFLYWTPTCKYCRQFFQYRLNTEEVGVFCIPLTDDLEFTEYYTEQKEIPYTQLCVVDTNGIAPIDASYIDAVPTFIIVDNRGNVIEQKIGITDIDSFFEKLYK